MSPISKLINEHTAVELANKQVDLRRRHQLLTMAIKGPNLANVAKIESSLETYLTNVYTTYEVDHVTSIFHNGRKLPIATIHHQTAEMWPTWQKNRTISKNLLNQYTMIGQYPR